MSSALFGLSSFNLINKISLTSVECNMPIPTSSVRTWPVLSYFGTLSANGSIYLHNWLVLCSLLHVGLCFIVCWFVITFHFSFKAILTFPIRRHLMTASSDFVISWSLLASDHPWLRPLCYGYHSYEISMNCGGAVWNALSKTDFFSLFPCFRLYLWQNFQGPFKWMRYLA